MIKGNEQVKTLTQRTLFVFTVHLPYKEFKSTKCLT